MELDRPLAGKVAVVTGSTSGIGLGIARSLAAAGADVVINGLGEPAAIERVLGELERDHPRSRFAYNGANLMKGEEAHALIEQTVAAFGRVDILVNNAGIQHVSPIESFPPEKYEAIIALNITAASLDGRTEGTPLTASIGSIKDTYESEVSAQLKTLGLDVDYVATNKLQCTDPNNTDQCLSEIRQSGHFGQLADYISLDYTTVVTAVSGTLDYDWTASDGTTSHKSSPFQVTLPIASVANDAECGEGGEIIPVRHDPFEFHLDQQNYRMSLPFTGDVAPGFTSRWRIELSAAETSLHDFQIVLLLSDGRQLASRPIHLTYFMPPKHKVLK